jgi:hypothetical protein
MAFAISPVRTVLWDQIQYSGAPSSFAWVLPVRAGAVIELASDAWFEALDAATSAQIVSPALNCPSSGGGCGLGCGAAEAGASLGPDGNIPDVTVVHQGTVGPYETVTLHADVPHALPDWLTAHGFAIDPGIQPMIDDYVSEGFDFIALRLLPGQGVQQMKPVRVVTPGMTPTLPLRMVAAGTGANVPITLFVVGEGRWQAQSFPNTTIAPDTVIWDFDQDRSNYATLRQQALAGNGGRTWLTPYAKKGTLLGPTTDGTGVPTSYNAANYAWSAQTIAEAYVRQGVDDGDTTVTSCLGPLAGHADSAAQVSGDCLGQGDGNGGAGGAGAGGAATGGAGGGAAGGQGGAGGGGATCIVPSGDLDARDFACGPLDDVAAALVGMHPEDVWITRLEANLPHAALAQDLTLEAAPQSPVEKWIYAAHAAHEPCPLLSAATSAASPPQAAASVRQRNRDALAGSVLVALAAALGRRRRRAPRPVLAPVSALR